MHTHIHVCLIRCVSQRYIVMSGDNAHMNKVHFEKSFFVWTLSWLSSLWNFVGIVCDSSLLPRREEWQNCFWTSYNKLCQVSSSSIHTLKLYQRAILRSKSYTKQTTTRTTTVSDICFCTPDKTRKIN